MDSKQTVKNYIGGFPAKKKLLTLVLALVCVACAALAIIEAAKPAPEPVLWEKDTKSGTQCYLDVVGVSDWVVEETRENTSSHVKTRTRFYLVLDEEENYYLARIPDSELYRLSDQSKYYETGVKKPEPYRLVGSLRKLDSDVRKNAMEALELSEAEFDEYLGDKVLLVGAVYNNPISIIAGIIAILLVVPTLIMLFSGIARSKLEKRALRNLEEQNLLDYAAQELGDGAAQQELDDRLRLGGRFLFGRGVGLAAPWNEVLWCYQRRQTVYFVTTRYFMIGTADGKLHSVSCKKQDNQRIQELMEQFAARNPEMLLGYTMNNMRAYKAACKERKAK